jgi:hypothetical protein
MMLEIEKLFHFLVNRGCFSERDIKNLAEQIHF